MAKLELTIIQCETPAELRAWFKKNHAHSEGMRLRMFKKATGIASVTYAQAVDEALCFGWIDGISNKYDSQSWLQRFTPRRPRSQWSRINVGHAERLIKEKRMQPAGLKQVESAKEDGRWQAAYASPKDAQIPADFLREVKKDPAGYAFFKTLNRANQYAIAYRLATAKKPETRARRLAQFVAMMSAGKKFY
jgi:uncharacterized protein YdeI (YjbR/CyaY-like superfamily)